MLPRLKWILLILISWPVWAQASSYSPVRPVAVCNGPSPNHIPSFTETTCRTDVIGPIDPQGRFIWVKARADIPPEMLASGEPLGLFVSAKASTRAYIGGTLIGRNGTPARDAVREIPGKADAVFPLAPGALKPGRNDVILAMSAHHGILALPDPVTVLLVGPYLQPGDFLLRRYMPVLPLLGMLLLASLYYGGQAIRSRGKNASPLLPLATLLATCQLLAEVSRAVIPYSYPYHDLRLSLIVLFSAGFGLCLLWHVADRFHPTHRKLLIPGGFVVTLVVILFTQSYDDKAAFAIMTPAILGALIAGLSAIRGAPLSRLYVALLTVTAISIYLTTSQFLDAYFYYLLALLLLALFSIEGRTLAKVRAQQAEEKARADRLQLALDESRERSMPTAIPIKSAGSVDLVPADQLLYCKGARDYVELVLEDGKSKLHNGSLSELEDSLPSTFLRVHRSYLVNTACIDRLERDPAGTGRLILTSGIRIPVSRRIMPRVRKALS